MKFHNHDTTTPYSTLPVKTPNALIITYWHGRHTRLARVNRVTIQLKIS